MRVKGSGAIYIRADGSVDPPTAPISTIDNVTYTLTGNINDSIVVERSNIVINGAGHTVQGSGSGNGLSLSGISNVRIKKTNIKGFSYGINLYASSNNNISGNNIAENVWRGIWLYLSSNNIISGNNIVNNMYGISPYISSNNNSIHGNNIVNNKFGMWLYLSSDNNISGNIITENDRGIMLGGSFDNNISGNNIWDNDNGIWIEYSFENTICGNQITKCTSYSMRFYDSSNHSISHNNFVNNTCQIYAYNSVNTWNDGYPSGGNYWSNYTGVDLHSGPYQNETGSDGIGDTPYVIDSNNTDNYPLQGMFFDFPVDWADRIYHLTTICNSTVSDFQFGVLFVYPDHAPGPPWTTFILFNVSGDAAGFCRIRIPKDVLDGDYEVTLDGFSMPSSMWKELPISDNATLYLYLTYPPDSHKIWIKGTTIIPEFPSFMIMQILVTATLLMVIVCRRKHSI